MASIRIDTKTGRAALKPRIAPYWHRLRIGFYLGFRVSAPGGVGIWYARRLIGERDYRYKSLGEVSEALDFEAALALAEAWVAEIDRGVGASRNGAAATVATACREYVEEIRKDRPAAAHDADMRFRRTVYGDPKRKKPLPANEIARRDLTKLREKNLRDWRNGLLEAGLSKASANRTLTALKAALNLAVTSRLTGAQLSVECRLAKPFKNAGKRRDLFLDHGERRRLLDAASGALRDLIEVAATTGARAGEIVNARRSAFDARTRTMTFGSGKTGIRTVPLSPAACALFTRLAKNKLPQAFLVPRDDGKQWAHSDWDELVREAAQRAELPAGVVLYTLRHSFITETLLAGLSTLTVSKLVGTSLAMIEKHYGHLVIDHAREQLAAVNLV